MASYFLLLLKWLFESLRLVCRVTVIAGLNFLSTRAANRLKRFAASELPPSAHNILTKFASGGMANYGDTYYFVTDASLEQV